MKRAERVAYLIDLYRLFPRVFLIGYGVLAWKSAIWFMALEHPSPEQAAFVTLLSGFFVPLTNFYMQNGVSRDSKSTPTVTAAATVQTEPEK